MSDTSESEILSLLADHLQRAAEDCAQLAWHPRRGHVYNRFRGCLREVLGCCEQLYYYRGYDNRWLVLGELVYFVLERSGDWLRGPKVAVLDSRGAPIAAMHTGGSVAHRKRAHPQFEWLSNKLRELHHDMLRIRDAATGVIGPILPEPLPGPHRDTRPVQVVTPAGIILPAGFRGQAA